MEYVIKINAECHVLSKTEGNKIFISNEFKSSFLFDSIRYLSTVFHKGDILPGETANVDITVLADNKLTNKLQVDSHFELKNGKFTVAKGVVQKIVSINQR